MKNLNNSRKGMGYLLAVGLVAGGTGWARAEIVVQSFSFTTTLTAAPLDPAPTINGSWLIQPYTGIPSELSSVQLEISSKLVYDGTLISLVGLQSYTAEVRSDFTFDFDPGPTPDQGSLDPVVILSGTAPAAPWTPFDVDGEQTQSTTVVLNTPAELDQYRSGSPVQVQVTGNLKTDALPGFHNTSDLGPASPAAFVNSPKVLPSFGLQLYQLQTTMVVTYFVPEGKAPVAMLFGLGVGWYFLRRGAKLRR